MLGDRRFVNPRLNDVLHAHMVVARCSYYSWCVDVTAPADCNPFQPCPTVSTLPRRPTDAPTASVAAPRFVLEGRCTEQFACRAFAWLRPLCFTFLQMYDVREPPI